MAPKEDTLASQSSDRLVVSLGRWSQFASRGFFAALAVLFAVAFFDPPRSRYALMGTLYLVALLFVLGIGCIVLLTVREVVLWKRKRWQFSLSTLLILTAELAIMLALITTAIRWSYS
jgi:hypothetical protein